MEGKLLRGELDARNQQRITLQQGEFICEADTLGSHGYVYVAIYPKAGSDATNSVEEWLNPGWDNIPLSTHTP